MKNNKAKERQNKDDSATEIHTKIINDSNVPIIESNAYINQGEEKNRQKHHNQSEQIVEPEKKRSKLKLEDADRYDLYAHIPDRKERGRCKNEGCQLKTPVFCIKCNAHLCFVDGRNCFKSFHFRKTDA